MKKSLVILLLTLSFGMVVAPAVAQAVDPTAAELELIAAINKERTKRGLVKVRFKGVLTTAARAHSKEMAARNILTHYSANGMTMPQRLRYYGYTSTGCTYWKVGENIGRARYGTLYATPTGMVALWMTSPDHKAVILTAAFRDIGCGMRVSATGYRYFTVDFGRRIY
jgi:uncharacterized protein YkwD